MEENCGRSRRPALIPEEVLSQEEVRDVQRRCIGDPLPVMDPCSQRPILQDPFRQAPAHHCVKVARESVVEDQQLPNRKRYHCSGDDRNRSVARTSVVNRGFKLRCSSIRGKIREFSSRNSTSSQLDQEDSGSHTQYSQATCFRFAREISDNIQYRSKVAPDAVSPTTGYATSCRNNRASSDGPVRLSVTQLLGACSRELRE